LSGRREQAFDELGLGCRRRAAPSRDSAGFELGAPLRRADGAQFDAACHLWVLRLSARLETEPFWTRIGILRG